MAYMEMFGNCSHSTHNNTEFLRHSVHTYNINHSSTEHIASTQQHNRSISHSQTMRYVLHRNDLSRSTRSHLDFLSFLFQFIAIASASYIGIVGINIADIAVATIIVRKSRLFATSIAAKTSYQ